MVASVVAVACWAGLVGGGCFTDSRECLSGLYCPPELTCVMTVGCCADPKWLKTIDGGVMAIMPSPDGSVSLGGVDPDTGETMAPTCGKASK
jgi:hypothetical protein